MPFSCHRLQRTLGEFAVGSTDGATGIPDDCLFVFVDPRCCFLEIGQDLLLLRWSDASECCEDLGGTGCCIARSSDCEAKELGHSRHLFAAMLEEETVSEIMLRHVPR
jgi:hypothetical protein